MYENHEYELFLDCYYVGIRCEMNEPQAATVFNSITPILKSLVIIAI